MKRPKLRKRIVKHPLVHAILCRIASTYIRLILLTSRIEKHIHPDTQHLFDQGKPAILTFWHGRLLIMYGVMPTSRPTHMLISLHNDGLLIARITRHLGAQIIHGSSSRGATSAMRAILTTLKQGDFVAITPDGPRGPFQQAATGSAQAAIATQCPIIPIAFSAKHHKRLRSWDKFMLPRLFTHIVYVIGAPIQPPIDRSAEATETLRLHTQEALITVTNQADLYAGVEVTAS